MGCFEDYKPALAMLGLQIVYAVLAIFSRATLVGGMSARVFVFYRNTIATLAMAPAAFFSLRKTNNRVSIGFTGFSLIFVTSLIGVTCNQNAYFEGLYLSSSTAASAIVNLIPAITFVMAAIAGMEKIKARSWRSLAKVLGTVICVGGAASMALIKGPKLLNSELLKPINDSLLNMFGLIGVKGDSWLLGCVLLFVSCCCWSFWIIMLVPISRYCPNHLISSTLLLFFAMLQSGTITLLVEDNTKVWNLPSPLQLASCLYAGSSSALSFFVQAWCVSKRGPLFTALFNPLCTVITTAISSLFIHEDLYFGSLIGAIAVIIGLYIVLWGKAKDNIKQEDLIDDCLVKEDSRIDLEQPLLFEDDIMDEERKKLNSNT